MKKQQITLKLESYRPNSTKCSVNIIERIAREMNLNITARGHYKKKNQIKITLISGPHVHKKSRDQYKIDKFGTYSVFNKINLQPIHEVDYVDDIDLIRERNKFLEFKNKLFRLNLDQGFFLTFTYLNRESLVF